MMDIGNINSSKICRACLTEDEKMESLLEQETLDMFVSCTSLSVYNVFIFIRKFRIIICFVDQT